MTGLRDEAPQTPPPRRPAPGEASATLRDVSSRTFDVVCLGILVADVIARPVDSLPEPGTLALVESITLRGGGCALNTSSALAKLGLHAAALGKVGDDAFGEFVLGLLAERGVADAGIVRDPAVPTSASVALVDSAGERTFLHLKGANAAVRADELGASPFAGRALHVAGALVLDALDGEPTAALLAEARRRGLHTSLDTVFDGSGRWERVLPALPHCDLVTPGLEEARAVTGERDPARAAERLRELGAGVAAVTGGPEGCWVSGLGHVAASPVEAVDGTGAGDAFAAGFLYGRLAGRPLDWCARFANAAGALATTAVGAFEGVGDLSATLRLARLE
ncbi:MAG TPA: sugar kinase [Gaiellaceae bacterium]|nr:sugar kinase [Gaiellaceae bacterium]